jgi:flagellar hook-associated protein 1 FlgK
MRGVSTFGAFTTARLGIYAAQKGLDVTGHNITNINTTGYTRQRLDQMSLLVGGTSRYSSGSDAIVGSGVLCTGVSQLRDPFLDIRFRNEQSSVGAMDAKLAGLEELTSVLDEVTKGNGSGIIEAQLNDFITQLQNLNGKTGQEEFDSLARTSAYSLVKLFNSYAERLNTIKETQVTGFNQDLETVNSILSNIRDLNDSILKSEIHGDSALELKDQRNLLIDNLSQYMKINVEYERISTGAGHAVDKLVIHLADKNGANISDLVNGSYATQLSIRPDPTPPLAYSPTYDLDLAALTNSQGTLLTGSTLVNLGDNDLYGSLQSTRELLTEAGEFTHQDVIASVDPQAATKRGIPYYQKALDSLANKFASVLNEANTNYLMDTNGNYLDQTTGFPLTYDDGTGTMVNLTKNTTLTPALQLQLDTNGKRLGGALFSNSSDGNNVANITASNISISKDWSVANIRIVNSFVAGATGLTPNSTDSSNIVHMLVLMDSDQAYRANETITDGLGTGVAYQGDTVFFQGSFQEHLTNIAATLANDVKTTTTLLNNYVASADNMNTSRESVAGVDLNDEATNLMQFQKSYAAACRLMTTLDEALDKLINGTGVVGR